MPELARIPIVVDQGGNDAVNIAPEKAQDAIKGKARTSKHALCRLVVVAHIDQQHLAAAFEKGKIRDAVHRRAAVPFRAHCPDCQLDGAGSWIPAVEHDASEQPVLAVEHADGLATAERAVLVALQLGDECADRLVLAVEELNHPTPLDPLSELPPPLWSMPPTAPLLSDVSPIPPIAP